MIRVNHGQFEAGQAPWNKGMKGLQLSPATQWKKGCESNRKLPLGSITIRHRKREKHPRAWVKIAEPNVWRERAKIVWTAAHGDIPAGHVIHHRDRNPLNDAIENLQAMTRADHAREHERDLRAAKNET